MVCSGLEATRVRVRDADAGDRLGQRPAEPVERPIGLDAVGHGRDRVAARTVGGGRDDAGWINQARLAIGQIVDASLRQADRPTANWAPGASVPVSVLPSSS